MALNQLNVPTPPAPIFNATEAPLSAGRSVCARFYGGFPDTRNCKAAIEQLPLGDTEVPYYNDGRYEDGHLPLSKRSGDCMIQVSVAGKRMPAIWKVAPSTIRSMASRVLGDCARDDGSYGGGFTTSSLAPMANWLSSQPDREMKVFNEIPANAAFLTVSVTTPFSYWIAPGQFDLEIPMIFAGAVAEAGLRLPPNSPERWNLRARLARLLEAAKEMDPRGMRIFWYDPPHTPPKPPGLARPGAAGNAEGDVAGKPQTPSAGEAGTATARKARRRRRAGMGEEGLMA
ncbi:MAG: hypothetical protein Q9221_004953 [Calogaya cf. arnoldii]